MTSSDTLTSAIPPRLSNQILIGPPEYIGGRSMCLAKHQQTGRYLRMGEREVFLLSNLDGQSTVSEIAIRYQERFGRVLSPDTWQSALALFEKRGLIETGLQSGPVPALLESGMESGPMNPFAGKVFFWNPDRFIASVEPWFRWLINGPMLLLWAALVIAAECSVLPQINLVWLDAVNQPVRSLLFRAPAVFAINSLFMFIHEMGHAVACKRYGGEVREMGFLFRYFSLCAYTRIDDILLFRERRHRVYVLLVGPLISLSLIPFAFWAWTHYPSISPLHTIATDLLIWYNAACLLQLVPFLQFDGYFMLAQLLRMPDLRKDSYHYLLNYSMAKLARRKPQSTAPECAPYVVPVYVTYGILSALVTTVAVTSLFRQYAQSLLHVLGVIPSLLIGCWVMGVVIWKLYSITWPALRSSYAAIGHRSL